MSSYEKFKQIGFSISISRSDYPVKKDYYQQHRDATFVLAFDNNDRDIKHLKKIIECFKSLGIENYKSALLPQNKRWVSLILDNKLTPDEIRDTLNEAYLQGQLILKEQLLFATSALDYFNRYRKQHPDTTTLIFEFDSSMFKGYLEKLKMGTDIDYEPKVERLADCNIRLRYSVLDDSQEGKQTIEHYLELYSEREGKGNVRLMAAELTQLGAFKIALQNHRQIFYGDSKDLANLTNYLFETKPPKIRAISVIGYDDKSKGYYFPAFAHDVNGNPIKANADKYFTETNIKSLMDCDDTITDGHWSSKLTDFLKLFNTAYANEGWLAFGFYISSLFSHIVFRHYRFFPFLSLHGEPHTGKILISKLLNRCFFIDSEGYTITASNTVKDHLIKISQKSNLVCTLLVDGKNNRFDYDSILPLYNRHAFTYSQDNKKPDLRLKATLSFVWNHELFTEKVTKESTISLRFAKNDHDKTIKEARSTLNDFNPKHLSFIGYTLLYKRKFFEEELIRFINYYQTHLKENGITVPHIAENYAIALGGIILFFSVINRDPPSLIRYDIS